MFIRFAEENDGPGLRELLADPDGFFERPDVTTLKSGSRSHVARGQVDGREIVVKRTRSKAIAKAIKRSFVPTRAARVWRASWRLHDMGVPTAQPLACVERRYGPLRGRSWQVMEWLPGVDALAFVQDASPQELRVAAYGIAALITTLHDARITHGDNNVRNFLICDGKAYLIDLDGLVIHPPWSPVLQRYIRRDLRRILHNWRVHPEMRKLLRQALLHYGAIAPDRPN
ncbi:MAG: lipopolysaccharide kinase InaA family protein [Halofilum sp. (in: g-proteobacteria)]